MTPKEARDCHSHISVRTAPTPRKANWIFEWVRSSLDEDVLVDHYHIRVNPDARESAYQAALLQASWTRSQVEPT
jgi:hypothetical protein